MIPYEMEKHHSYKKDFLDLMRQFYNSQESENQSTFFCKGCFTFLQWAILLKIHTGGWTNLSRFNKFLEKIRIPPGKMPKFSHTPWKENF